MATRDSKAPLRTVKRVQFGILSPDEIVSTTNKLSTTHHNQNCIKILRKKSLIAQFAQISPYTCSMFTNSVFSKQFLASYVRHRGWHMFPRDNGSWPPEIGRPYGSQTGRYRPPFQVPNVCRQHDRMSRPFWPYRSRQARISCWFHNENY